MATISITTPSDGQTIDASDVATPLNTIVSEINGSLNSDNIASGGVVPNNLISGTGTSWTWQSFTPTYSNLTLGNGTMTASYTQIGKTVIARYKLVFGSTTSISSSVYISLPVTAASHYSSGKSPVGVSFFEDNTGTDFIGYAMLEDSTTEYVPVVVATSLTYTSWGRMAAAAPFTWATDDILYSEVVYEAA